VRADPAVLRCLATLACDGPDALAALRWRSARAAAGGEGVLECAQALRVVSPLASFVTRTDEPQTDARAIVAAGLLDRARGQAALALLRRVLTDPAVAAARPIVIKGAALVLAGVHGGDRALSDADLVVPADAVDAVAAVARRLGATWHGRAPGGYEAGVITDGDAMVDVHVGLSQGGGRGVVTSHADLALRCVSLPASAGLAGVLVPDAAMARALAIDHFARRHEGEPSHALRTLQDLARLVEPAAPATRLERVALAFRTGRDETDAEASAFIAGLGRVVALDVPQAVRWTRFVERWIEEAVAAGPRALWRLVRARVVPPLDEMRRDADEPRARTALRYLARPPRLLLTAATGLARRRLRRDESRAIEDWRAFLVDDRPARAT